MQDHFKHVFIDEAGQATEQETCTALAGIISADVGQLVMAGDPQQLGPIVRSSLAVKYGLSVSLLERLMTGAPYTNPETGNRDSRCVTKLIRNFRSVVEFSRIKNVNMFSLLPSPQVPQEPARSAWSALLQGRAGALRGVRPGGQLPRVQGADGDQPGPDSSHLPRDYWSGEASKGKQSK